MKHSSLLAFIISGIITTTPAAAQLQEIKVLTYNIHHGENVNGTLNLQGIANVILATDPDLVALQEVDSVTQRTQKTDQLKELAAQTGMYIYFGKAMNYEGGGYGTGILSKYPIKQSYSIALPPGEAGSEPRVAAVVKVQLPGDSLLQFISTHLDHKNAETRTNQINVLLQHVQGTEPVIIGGDFNALPDAKEIGLVTKHFKDATATLGGTHPSDTPTHKIDYIFLSHKYKWEIKKAKVIEEAVASDHRPVMCELELK